MGLSLGSLILFTYLCTQIAIVLFQLKQQEYEIEYGLPILWRYALRRRVW